MKELVISRDELQVLINDIYCGDRRYFRGTYPFYGTTLFDLDFKKSEIMNIVDQQLFEEARRVRTPRGMDKDDMVHYGQLKDCLLSSGFLNYENEDEVIGWLRKRRQDSVDPSEGQNFLFLAVDTNLLYYRFISRHMSFKDPDGKPFHDGLRYMVSDIVGEEISHRIQHKYRGDEISAFRSRFNDKELVGELLNANDLRGRKAKLAKIEHDFVKYHLKASRASGTGSNDKEANDIAMAKSYGDRAQIGNHIAYMLTADRDMVGHANVYGMAAMQLVQPTSVPKHLRAHPWALRNLIYDISALFGAFSLEHNEEKITVLGEWKHKTDDDYKKERMKVKFTNDDRYSSVENELRRSRSMLAMMNERT